MLEDLSQIDVVSWDDGIDCSEKMSYHYNIQLHLVNELKNKSLTSFTPFTFQIVKFLTSFHKLATFQIITIHLSMFQSFKEENSFIISVHPFFLELNNNLGHIHEVCFSSRPKRRIVSPLLWISRVYEASSVPVRTLHGMSVGHSNPQHIFWYVWKTVCSTLKFECDDTFNYS